MGLGIPALGNWLPSRMKKADVGIVGGGLAGLASAIQLADRGHQVVLFEKNRYPFHRRNRLSHSRDLPLLHPTPPRMCTLFSL